jgi:hypothetical protein
MKRKLLYTAIIILGFSMVASSNNLNRAGKDKNNVCEKSLMLTKQENAVEEIIISMPLNHFMLSLAEW